MMIRITWEDDENNEDYHPDTDDKDDLVAGDHHNGQRGRGHRGQPGERWAGQQEGSCQVIIQLQPNFHLDDIDADHQDDRPRAEAKESEGEQPDTEDAGGHGQLHHQHHHQRH